MHKNIILQYQLQYIYSLYSLYLLTHSTCFENKMMMMMMIQFRSTVNTNQIKSIILLQNTRSVQKMESLVHFAHEKCIIFVILYVFVLTTTKTRH